MRRTVDILCLVFAIVSLMACYEDKGNYDYTELNEISVKNWSALIRYGIKTGEFNDVNVTEIVSILLYSYQGIRMWSRIIPVSNKTIHSVVMNIKRQLYKK